MKRDEPLKTYLFSFNYVVARQPWNTFSMRSQIIQDTLKNFRKFLDQKYCFLDVDLPKIVICTDKSFFFFEESELKSKRKSIGIRMEQLKIFTNKENGVEIRIMGKSNKETENVFILCFCMETLKMCWCNKDENIWQYSFLEVN